jgi:hypothetical protein
MQVIIRPRRNARVCRIPLWAKHVDDCIISLRLEVLAHTTSLAPPLCIEVLLSRQKSKRLCICVLGVSVCLFSTSLFYWILKLFGYYDIFALHFIVSKSLLGVVEITMFSHLLVTMQFRDYRLLHSNDQSLNDSSQKLYFSLI